MRVRSTVFGHCICNLLTRPEEIREFQLWMIQVNKSSWSQFNQAVCGLRFLYSITLSRPWVVQSVPYGKRPKSLPTVLGQEEVNRLIGCVDHLKHRAVLLTLYSAGLRLTEATNLKAQHIDSQRMQIKIVQGKGNRDRFVPLSPRLLHVLLEYWIAAKTTDFLFPGKTPNVPLHGATIQICCKLAAAKAHLNKHATPHTLPRLERIVLWQAPTDLVAKRREWLTMRNVFTTKECNSRMSASRVSVSQPKASLTVWGSYAAKQSEP